MLTADDKDKQIAPYIFNGSTTMIGVSVTVIALFKIIKTQFESYADELLAFDNIIFITSAILSYSAIRKDRSQKLERLAEIFFLLGMIIMLITGIILVYADR